MVQCYFNQPKLQSNAIIIVEYWARTSHTTDQNKGGSVANSANGVNAGFKADVKDSLTNDNARIESQQVSVSSKGNVTLSGASIKADSVDVQSEQGGLVVESRQDKDVAVKGKSV